eukprot:COSAG02_NODE_23960_length_701_cov_1.472637_1_plen_212_part_10
MTFGCARARVCDLITKSLHITTSSVRCAHPPPFVVALCLALLSPYRYEIAIDMQSDDSDTASGHIRWGSDSCVFGRENEREAYENEGRAYRTMHDSCVFGRENESEAYENESRAYRTMQEVMATTRSFSVVGCITLTDRVHGSHRPGPPFDYTDCHSRPSLAWLHTQEGTTAQCTTVSCASRGGSKAREALRGSLLQISLSSLLGYACEHIL